MSARIDIAPEQVLAAVDLGSNSFHMLVARLRGTDLHVLDRLREPVRLGAGLDAKSRLRVDAMDAALACLERFGQRVRDLPPGSVRAVGTNTLRVARNAAKFLTRAETALGHPIEVIAGFEEARLIYLGVAESLADAGGRRLVIDIGGGSTELIVGRGREPLLLESLHVGCVSMTQRHFADGKVTRKAMKRAQLAARQQFEPVEVAVRNSGYSTAAGASGTVRAIGAVLGELGLSESDTITAKALGQLEERMCELGDVQHFGRLGFSEDRRAVIAGGFAVLAAAFDALALERLTVAGGALREGLLLDLTGRLLHTDIDVRSRSIAAFRERFRVDAGHAERIRNTAANLLVQVASSWQLREAEVGQLLGWAAELVEIGLIVAHTQYHKHGAYIVERADLAGFSREEQRLLAALVRAHRRKFPVEAFDGLRPPWDRRALRAAVLLRLAVLLHRGRDANPLPELRCMAHAKRVELAFPAGWLDAHPLTVADLEEEAAFLRAADVDLVWR
jgi:exopolyphosphatase/guanosine-5'-triphosphate,3'-diphosphate pyrophosphatase